jgi:hypothetical protein
MANFLLIGQGKNKNGENYHKNGERVEMEKIGLKMRKLSEHGEIIVKISLSLSIGETLHCPVSSV